MKKKYKILFATLLVFCLLTGSVMPGYAIEENEVEAFFDSQKAAEELNKIGLFNGDGTGFSLERVPNRAEVAAMFIRLLGKDAEAMAGEYKHPFTDSDMWASKYIGYMYENGLTKGVSETEFAPYEEASANMYLTFALRALGYDSTTDFQWDKAAEKAQEIGLLYSNEKDTEMIEHFNRGGLAIISFRMLYVIPKDGLFPLAYYLIEDGSLDVETVYGTQIVKALDNIELSKFMEMIEIKTEEITTNEYWEENFEKLAEILGLEEEEMKNINFIDDFDDYITEEDYPELINFLFETVFKMPKIIDYKVKNYWMERGIDYTTETDILEEYVGCKISLKILSWGGILVEGEKAYSGNTPFYVRDIDKILYLIEFALNQNISPDNGHTVHF